MHHQLLLLKLLDRKEQKKGCRPKTHSCLSVFQVPRIAFRSTCHTNSSLLGASISSMAEDLFVVVQRLIKTLSPEFREFCIGCCRRNAPCPTDDCLNDQPNDILI